MSPNRNILIIDSNESIRNTLKENFERDGFTVYGAYDEETTFYNLEHYRINLIVSEVLLESTDGVQLCKAIKENPKFNHIPYIILTSANDHMVEIKCLRNGADEFFVKRNVNRQELMLKIEILLERFTLYSYTKRNLHNDMVGSLEQLRLKRLLKMSVSLKLSGRLRVGSAMGSGEIVLKDGQIINAVYGSVEGLEAVFEMDRRKESVFTIDLVDVTIFNPNMDQSTETIISLLED